MMVDVELFKRWDVIAMCIAMAIVFVLEMLGVFGHKYITLTAIIRSAPKWGLAMAWGWLGWHFIWGG